MPTVKKPEEIFIQRTEYSNNYEYILRTSYEQEFVNLTSTNTNIFISGDTGSGKTWLYEIFCQTRKIPFVTVNLAKCDYHTSIYPLLKNTILGSTIQVSDGDDIVEKCYEALYQKSQTKYTYIVLDNLERIVSNASFKENIVTLINLLEDPLLSKYKIRYMLVGIPSSLKEFFHDIEYFQPIANRISEMRKVEGFTKNELISFIEKTFNDLLFFGINKAKITEISEYILEITDGMPLRVQQYLLLLSKQIISNAKEYNRELLSKAAHELLKTHYAEIETLAEQYFIEPNGKVKRRNQVIFLLGKIGKENIFTLEQLATLMKRFFPKTTEDYTIQINTIVPLASGAKPLIKKIDKKRFRLNDTNVKMWINSQLYIDLKDEIVRKKV